MFGKRFARFLTKEELNNCYPFDQGQVRHLCRMRTPQHPLRRGRRQQREEPRMAEFPPRGQVEHPARRCGKAIRSGRRIPEQLPLSRRGWGLRLESGYGIHRLSVAWPSGGRRMGDRVLGILSSPMSDGRSLNPFMLTFPDNSFLSPSLVCPAFGVMLEQTVYARALCEDFRHFLSESSITGHGLCEDFPKKLFGDSLASGSAEKSFSMKMFGDHVRAKTNLFLWYFEGKNQEMRVRRGRLFE